MKRSPVGLLLSMVVALAGCGGGAGGTTPTTTVSNAGGSGANSSNAANPSLVPAALSVLLSTPTVVTGSAARRAEYISPNTATIVVDVGGNAVTYNVATSNTAAYGTPGFVPTAARPCIYVADGGSNNTTRSCTLLFSAPAGAAFIYVEALDAASHALAAGTANPTIVAAQTNLVAITLSPIIQTQAITLAYTASSSVSASSVATTGSSSYCGSGTNCTVLAFDASQPIVVFGAIHLSVLDPGGNAIPGAKPQSPPTTPETTTPNTDPFMLPISILSLTATSGSIQTSGVLYGLSSNVMSTNSSPTCSGGVPVTGTLGTYFANANALASAPSATLCYNGGGYTWNAAGSPPSDEISAGPGGGATPTYIMFTPMLTANNGNTIYVGQSGESGNVVTATLGASSATGGGTSPDGTCASETALSVGTTTMGPGQSIPSTANGFGIASFTLTPPSAGHACTISYQFRNQGVIVSRAYTGTGGSIVVTFSHNHAKP